MDKKKVKKTDEVKSAPEPKAKRSTRKVPHEVFFQYMGHEFATHDILEKAKKEFIERGNKASSIKSIDLYIKPEENAAYYVINGGVDGGKVNLG
jgi:hypothetical protein